LLLTEILEQPHMPGRGTVERATAQGWRLSGWHIGVHIAPRSATEFAARAGGAVPVIEGALKTKDPSVNLIERPAGWAFWYTHVSEPDARDAAALAKTVRGALRLIEQQDPTLRLCAGVGGTHPGIAGIGRSLHEAEQACMLARTHDQAAWVEHIDTTSFKRLLVAWSSAGPLGEFVAGLLEPLHNADPTGELEQTLRIYLDNESSPTITAAALGVHRNTVMNRLDKIYPLLPIDLSRADQRLAVQLALHAAATGGRAENESNWPVQHDE
jgi:hypothetical protein